jgi:hypothetical protein
MPTVEDVNSLVRFFHLDHKIEVSHAEGQLKTASSEDSALIALHYGDRVQIVSFEDDGWAKLARGYGYVRANARQLVKSENLSFRLVTYGRILFLTFLLFTLFLLKLVALSTKLAV